MHKSVIVALAVCLFAPVCSRGEDVPQAAALPGFVTVNATESGQALSRQFPAGTSLKAALQATFPALEKRFGNRPDILVAYEDQRTHRAVNVSFAVRSNGQPIKGLVCARATDQGTTVAVILCRADAPGSEWAKLMATPGQGAPADAASDDLAAVKAQAAKVPLKTYNFPDNTGSVGIAEGWTTNAKTIGGATLVGPADQNVYMGVSAEVLTPDSPMVQMQRQLTMQARQFRQPDPPPIQMLMAPYSPDPAKALLNVSPAISQMAQRAGRPPSAITAIVQQWPMKAFSANGHAALILCDVDKGAGGQVRHYRSLIQMEVYMVGQGTWAFYATQLLAPKDTFDKDLPVMLAQSMSLKENAAVIQQNTQNAIAAQNRWFAAQQAAHKQVTDAFDSYNKSVERNSTIRSRSNTDFDETIRGYRTVEDTTTGERTSVDLGNVHDVVEHLNQADPGRYREIPLRDELYPLPGQDH